MRMEAPVCPATVSPEAAPAWPSLGVAPCGACRMMSSAAPRGRRGPRAATGQNVLSHGCWVLVLAWAPRSKQRAPTQGTKTMIRCSWVSLRGHKRGRGGCGPQRQGEQGGRHSDRPHRWGRPRLGHIGNCTVSFLRLQTGVRTPLQPGSPEPHPRSHPTPTASRNRESCYSELAPLQPNKGCLQIWCPGSQHVPVTKPPAARPPWHPQLKPGPPWT